MSSPLSAAAERRAVRCHGHRSWARRAPPTARSPPGGWLVGGAFLGLGTFAEVRESPENARTFCCSQKDDYSFPPQVHRWARPFVTDLRRRGLIWGRPTTGRTSWKPSSPRRCPF